MLSFDLDSTLADTRQRKGVVEKYKNAGLPVDWDDYASHCLNDEPMGLVYALRVMQETIPWVVISGRSEGAREGTLAWLKANGLKPFSVYLEDDTAKHTAMGHSEWKSSRVIEVSKKVGGITVHFDDWPDVATLIEEKSNGAIRGVTVTPNGMRAVWADNPGEMAEVL